jgi:type IVB pilus formation R64 PilN family outer membrane protein
MKRFVLVCAPFFLTACVGTLRTAPPQINADETIASDFAQLMRSGNTVIPNNMVREIDDAFYVDAVLLDAQKTPECDLTFAPQTPASVYQFAQSVSKDCGIPVRVSVDAQAALRREAQSAPDSVDVLLPPGASVPPPTPTSLARRGFGEVQSDRIELQYTGPLTGLLDAVTSRLGLSWRYRDKAVTIFHVDTRSYYIASLPTTTRMDAVVTAGTTSSAGVSSGGTSGGTSGASDGGLSGSSGSTQSTTVALSSDPSEDLTKAVEATLTRDVGRAYLSTSTQTLTVTDTPDVLEQIGRMIDDRNAFSTRQVLMNVKAVRVTTNKSDAFGIDWNLIYTDVARSTGVGLVRPFNATAEATAGSINILEGSRFDGSQLILKALSKTGNVSILTQASGTTLNMEAVPIQIATQTSFLASTSTTQTANVGSTNAQTPGTVTTGFNMTLLPYIMQDAKTVLLHFSVNLSTLNNIRRVGSGDNAIEVPEIDSQIFSQKVKLQSGETLVLSGFEQATTSAERSGTGSPWNFLFGGGASASKKNEVLVILITPVVMR